MRIANRPSSSNLMYSLALENRLHVSTTPSMHWLAKSINTMDLPGQLRAKELEPESVCFQSIGLRGTFFMSAMYGTSTSTS